MGDLSYRSLSNHVEDLASGRSVEPGEIFTMTSDEENDPHNARLINEGVFIKAEPTVPVNSRKGGSD